MLPVLHRAIVSWWYVFLHSSEEMHVNNFSVTLPVHISQLLLRPATALSIVVTAPISQRHHAISEEVQATSHGCNLVDTTRPFAVFCGLGEVEYTCLLFTVGELSATFRRNIVSYGQECVLCLLNHMVVIYVADPRQHNAMWLVLPDLCSSEATMLISQNTLISPYARLSENNYIHIFVLRIINGPINDLADSRRGTHTGVPWHIKGGFRCG